jgi:predicted ATPase/signal transduction histidine kinase
MAMEPSSRLYETLRADEEFALCRVRQKGSLSTVLEVTSVAEYPSVGSLARLEHEYSFRDELDPDWAVRPLALTRRGGQATLVLEDPGGELLDRLLGKPMELGRFLRLAINLAAGLGKLHQRGLIHKDIKPANTLVDSATDKVWFTGFGFASRLPRERQTAEPPEVIAGTLAYMAPEQTGRMNRSIDSRSDLYSLGVTLYQMLTSALPFQASNPTEWVHCHIARQPPSPNERVTEIPEPVSAIVLKLLAKNAEERYQAAAGLEADLKKCLMEWESAGRIEPFPLGKEDMPGRLLIPEKLYGRESECQILLDAFDRVTASGKPELVLVSGYSGIGKSSLVHELHKSIILPRGIFISGKFDQQKRNIPYATLAQAFQNLVHQILSKNEEEVFHWRATILEALGSNGQLMINLIPELELVIGKQPAVPEFPPQEARNRFETVLRRFIGVFARKEHPLVLFLDDLQWLDSGTLKALEQMVTDSGVQHLLLVGAYRDNELSNQHPLMLTLDAIRKTEAIVHEIILDPLSLTDVRKLLADALHCEPADAGPLAELLYEKTRGNPFFTIQFLINLAEEHLLEFDAAGALWRWDMERIRAKGFTDNVVDLMIGKLNRLSDATQKALGKLACLGNVVELATLNLVQEESEEEIQASLWEAVRVGLVLRLDSAYSFLHDRVREAAYALIPESERAAVHLKIGRLFVARTVTEEIEERIFEIANQLNRGVALITAPQERVRVAELNLIAGKRAKISTAYASALEYLVAGCALLAEDSWEQRYALTFALEFERAECEFLTGDIAAAEKRLSMLSERAKDLIDSAVVARLRTELYTTLDQSDRAVQVGLEYLRRIGVDWSAHPTKDEVRQEYEQIWQQLGSRPIEALVDLPPMTDPVCKATLDVLTVLEEPAHFADENLRCLVVARMVNLSLKHGNSDGSCVAYVDLGWFVIPRFDDYKPAFRFGKLGLDLVEKRGLERFRTRVFQCFGYFIDPWSRHLGTSVELLRRSFATAQETGDLKYAIYACDRLVTLLLAVGDPLSDVQREAENGLEFARKAKFGYTVDIITGQLALIRTLRGLTSSLLSFNDAEFDEARFEQHVETDPHLVFARCWYWIRKLQALFYAGDYVSALAAASKARPVLQTMPYAGIDLPDHFVSSKTIGRPGVFESVEYLFYDALARAARYDSATPEERAEYRETLAAHHKQIVLWAKNCPQNFGNRASLVGGEIARIEGRDLEAMHLYEEAIQSARENGFIQNEAIAYEVAAQFYLARGFETIGRAYIRNGRYCYLRWGALGKVQQIDQRYPPSHEERPPSLTATLETPVEQLDLGTVMKVSQAVSGEIVLEKLIETLMRIAIEHAGAERGLLLLHQREELRIEAEARTSRNGVQVRLRQAAAIPAELPESLLRYVIRTQQGVILDDASSQSLFSGDPYVLQERPRSVLCLPLIKQSNLIGALYLENNLAPRVFTPKRLAMLELLASQAAISLDHARLYAEAKRAEELQAAMVRERETFAQQRVAQLAKANAALRSSLDELASVPQLDEFIGQVMAAITGQLGAVSSTLSLFGPDNQTMALELIYQDGRVRSPDEMGYPKHLRTIARDEFIASRLDQSISLERLDSPLEPRLPEGVRTYLFEQGVKSVLLIPLSSKGQVDGMLSFRFINEREFQEEELEIARALATQASLAIQLTQLAKTARESAVLEERNRLAGEIHDSLAQSFAGISMQLSAAGRAMDRKSKDARNHIERANELARFGLSEARRSALSLRSNIIEESGLIEALHKLTERSNIPGLISCSFQASQVDEKTLSTQVQQDLLRIGQEAISNALRHAQPTEIRVSLRGNPPNLVLKVVDNGSGLEKAGPSGGQGFGFDNMRARAKSLGAALDIRSRPGRGTSVIVRLRIPS